jgi:polysaccharide pyruvyl transferase CsaB
MRAVVFGYYGFGNVGDEAVLWAMRQHLEEQVPGLRLYVLSADPEATAAVHGTEAVPRTDRVLVQRAIRRSDLVLSGGGSLFQDATSWRSPLFYGWLHELAHRARRPLLVYAQGVGPLRRALSRWVTRRAMEHASYITVRDSASAVLLKRLGVRRTVTVVCDPVFGLPAERLTPSDPWLAVSVRAWPGAWLEPLASGIRAAQAEAGLPVRVLCLHESYDRPVCEALTRHLGADLVVVRTPQEALRTFAGAAVTVAMRLHALILAALAGSVTVGLAYDPKVEALAQLLPGNEVLPIVALRQEAVRDAVRRALRELEARRQKIQSVLPTLGERARAPARIAATMLGGLPVPQGG